MRYTIPDLLPGTLYAIQMRSIAGPMTSEWSRTFTVLTVEDLRRPDEPQNVTWAPSGDTFHGEWDAVLLNEEGAEVKIDRYEVELVANGVAKFASIAAQETGGRVVFDLSFAANRAMFGVARPTIAMRVRAISASRISSLWTSAITAQNPQPGPVTDFVATGLPDAISFTWTPPTDTDLDEKNPYKIYVGTTADFVPGSNNIAYEGPGNSTVWGTTTYTTQYFKIRAVDKFGQESTSDAVASATPSSPFLVDIEPPENATNFGATPVFDTDRQVAYADTTWTASTSDDVQNYVVRYSTNNTNWQYVTVPSDTTAARIDNLLPGVAYHFGIRAVDYASNESVWSPISPITMPNDTVPPSTPAAPTASSSTQRISVSHSGKKSDGSNMEADVAFYKVYANTNNGFTPAATNMLGTIRNGPALVETFSIPAAASTPGARNETWYVKVVAVDRAGNESPASAQATANPSLIDTAFIVDAAITSAKISNLDVNKLTAGTGLVTDFNIKSTLTIGDVGATGAIKSHGYNPAGSTGFYLGSDGLVIKSGSIEAPAIKVQAGVNLIPPQYADFEYVTAYYAGGTYGGVEYTPGINSSQPNVQFSVGTNGGRFGNQYLLVKTTGTVSSPTIYLSPNETESNINLDPGKTYILSFYARNPVAVPVSVGSAVRWSNGTTTPVMGPQALPLSQTGWTRYSAVFTVPDGLSQGAVRFTTNASAAGVEFHIDAVQLEEKIAGLDTPSSWKPSSTTIIDGSRVRTGALISNQTVLVGTETLPIWSIPMNGAATFANLLVRGNMVVGGPNDGPSTTMSSANYSPGVAGWQFRSDGTADLLGLQAGSINGASVEVGTLKPSSLGDSENDDPLDAVISLEGALVASGAMGERVIMSGDGFTAIGPHESAIVSKTMVDGVATLVTLENHGYAAGGTIFVSGVGEPYDGEWTIQDVPSSTSLRYAVVGTPPNESTVASGGMVQGQDLTGTRAQPVNVDFPTNGGKPNIISGRTTSNILTVTNTAQFDKFVSLNSGAVMTIASTVQAPAGAPTVTWTYPSLTLRGITATDIRGITKGHNNNIFVLSYRSSNNSVYISEHDAVTGALIANRYVNTPTGTLPYTWRHGLVHRNGYYYILYTTAQFAGAPTTQNVITLNSSFSTVGTVSLVSAGAYTYSASLGWDHTNGRLMHGYTSSSTEQIIVRTFAIGANGIPNTGGAITQSIGISGVQVGFMARGPFGPADADRFIVKSRNYYSYYSYQRNIVVMNPTTGAVISAELFPAADSSNTPDGYYDDATGDIYDVSSGGARRQYRGGDALNTITSKWVAYSWTTNDGSLETNLSPRTSVNPPLRSTLSVTIPAIPIGLARTTDPRKANIWVASQKSDPGASGTAWKLRSTINYPATSALINPYQTIGTATPKTTNQFLVATGGQATIRSASGRSFWSGDDEAQFFGLMLKGGTDVTNTYENVPPLRIRDVGNVSEMRFDGNEIMVVNINDTSRTTSTANLFLQKDGGNIYLGQNSRALRTMRWGGSRVTANASGVVTVTHGMGTTPDVVMVTLRGDAAPRFYRVFNVTATTFQVELWTSAGTNISNTANADFDWVAYA